MRTWIAESGLSRLPRDGSWTAFTAWAHNNSKEWQQPFAQALLATMLYNHQRYTDTCNIVIGYDWRSDSCKTTHA